MDLFGKLSAAIETHSKRNAFYIGESFFTYHQLAIRISVIRQHISTILTTEEKVIGIMANDDIDTYAAIIACWFEGKCYVPLSPEAPKERNDLVIQRSGMQFLIDSSGKYSSSGITLLEYAGSPVTDIDLQPKMGSDNDLAYILFTSGTTGIPKGVPITKANLLAFVDAFHALQLSIDENDKWLQMFDLGFDLSIMSYLLPLLHGACVYTIPKGKIRYNYIAKLIDEQQLTGALLVPSVVQYLRPYFSEISYPSMKLCLFCGEALPMELTAEWSHCLPNATLINFYGPTENTIFCSYYHFNKTDREKNKSYKNVLSIGRAMKDVMMVIVNDRDEILPPGEKGELCLAGAMLSPGYWNDEITNARAFFYLDYQGERTRFYRTGDLCIADTEGDIMYIERMDLQVKVQGFRIELLEIEFHARQFLKNLPVLAMIFNRSGSNEIALIVQSTPTDPSSLLDYLKTRLPAYMIPSQVLFQSAFPYNTNGKIDRNSLKKVLLSNE